ncbi:MAG: haloalkane dehalogenase [Actinomycetia bacterium]|nr:haloalkane dehalogenase [Actinomycetes bacterium]
MSNFASSKNHVEVLGKRMAYTEAGEGDPIVFLHGNPTSSYLWRKVIPAVVGQGRCLAPDLIGMGDSDKLDDSGPGSYRFVEHRRYLDGWLEAVGATDNVTLVGHDWGGALAFDWANRNRDAVRGLVYMETIVCPVSWDDWPGPARGIFQAMRSPAGETIVIEKNVFVERILPASVLDPLSEEVMNEYRRPYVEGGETRRPTLTWPREIPIDGDPADVAEIAAAYGKWLAESDVPKLFINAKPGTILIGKQREICRSWPNQTEKTVRGTHFIQEDSGERIGAYIADWMAGI